MEDIFLREDLLDTGTGCREKLCMPHPCKCAGSCWMGLLGGVIWWKVSLSMTEGWTGRSLKVPSNPNHSMVPWITPKCWEA